VEFKKGLFGSDKVEQVHYNLHNFLSPKNSLTINPKP